ncbi:MAG: hypothetical protein J7639_32780 [Paenibacillaceae bacterium]|nr:hypothetical protein [Paenibacillaceae bacterium]
MVSKESNRLRFGRFTPVILGMSLVLGACSGGGKEAQTSAPSASPAPSAAGSEGAFAKHLDITWVGYNLPGVLYPKDHATKKIIEDKFNVTINQIDLDVSNGQQRNLFFAEGKTADMLSINTGLHEQEIDQGVFKELNLDDMRRKMPNHFKQLEAFIPYDVIKARTEYKGKHYGVPFTNYASFLSFVQGIRQDWLENVGIAKMPETIDEYTNVLRKFTFGDPDKNGKNDTYGMHGILGNFGSYVYGAFGVPSSSLAFYADDKGQIYPVGLSDNRKNMLKQLASWYKEGLIDPESITDTRARQRAKWKEGKFGIISDNPWWFASTTTDNLTDMVTSANPQAKIAFLKPFTGPTGQKGASNRAYANVTYGYFFGRDISDEKLDRLLAIKDYIAGNEELFIRLYYGEQGKHYDLDAEKKIVVKDPYKESANVAKEGLGQFYVASTMVNWEFQEKYLVGKADMPEYDIGRESPFFPTDVNFNYKGLNASLLQYSATLKTIADEFEIKAIAGQINIDAEWENYKKRFLSSGGEQVAKEFQKLYDESNKK